MTTEVKNRTWVKDAAIIFLAVLLVLTFFSRTILNASLTEVATQEVRSGTITAKVRGTGKVVANGNNSVKAKGTVTIAKVMVRTGEEVKAGDVLFVLGAGDSSELEAAKNALYDLEASYDSAVAALPIGSSFASEQANIKARKRDITTAQARFDAAKAALKANPLQDQAELEELIKRRDELEKEILELTAALNKKTNELDAEKATLDDAMTRLNYLRSLLSSLQTVSDTPAPPTPTSTAAPEASETEAAIESQPENYAPSTGEDAEPSPTPVPLTIEDLEQAVKEAEEKVTELSAQYAIDLNIKNKEINEIKAQIYKYQSELDGIESQIQAWSGYNTSYTEYIEARNALESARDAYAVAQANLGEAMARQGQSSSTAYIAVETAARKIEQQKEKIKELSGEGDEKNITAAVSGTVTEINCSSGDMVIKDDILAVIEVADMGYTVSFSVTNDQARRLKVGDEATISNFYWGNEIKATLKSIATDKENPQNKKILTFDLEGNVTAGSELTISVGQKSASYDLVVPNSAIRSDNNGQFVLAVSAKNSPLGNRYIAKRVKVDVLAEDDTNSAVTAELDSGDFVITTTSAPVSSGEQVRLADSAN